MRQAPSIISGIFVIVGLPLVIGGGWLVLLSGSPFYLIAGLSYLVTGLLLFRRERAAALAYALFLVATLAWTVAEVGFDVWAMLARVSLPVALGFVFVVPGITRPLYLGAAHKWIVPSAIALVFTALLGCLSSKGGPAEARLPSPPGISDPAFRWASYGGDAGGTRYAPLAQINADNVRELQQVWIYRTGHARLDGKPVSGTTFQATPIQVGRQLILCTPFNTIISVDGDSGKELWRFDPKIDRAGPVTFVCRGVAYHAGAGQGPCRARILSATLDNRLLALDAHNGRPCSGFGRDGSVNLNEGFDKALPGYHAVTSPPTIVNDVAVVGSFILDGQSTSEPSGAVRGYDVTTGRLLWAWDAVGPKALGPGEPYSQNSPNSWSVASADPDLNLVYLPMGGGTPDFFAGSHNHRNRYGSSVVALDATTGDVRWSFQTVHHDIWDFDLASQPVLFDFGGIGSSTPAVAVPTKRGEIFILDRRSGRPLVPVREKAVPTGGAPEEHPAPTQPFVAKFHSFAPPHLREADMWGVTLFDQLWCRIAFKRARYDGPFTPPSLQGSIVHTGSFGGFNWGSVSIDLQRHLLIGNFNTLPYILKLIPRAEADASHLVPAGTAPGPRMRFEHGQVSFAQTGLPYAASMGAFLSPVGIPCSAPPWGQIGAIDLTNGRLRWVRPLGTTRDIAPLGISLPLGPPNIGGTITTRGGLSFVGAATDDYIRAFDSATGAELWRQRLPAGGQATPMTYVSPSSGRQYVVIAAGGHATLGTKAGDYLLAYALPAKPRTRGQR